MEVYAVPVQLQQVVMNLVLNAREAMLDQGGTLTIRAEATLEAVCIEVHDTGTGIRPEDRDRVHHLILADSFGIFEDLAGRFSPSAPSIASMGRPHLRLSGEEVARKVHEAGGLVGPAHAFTPWTSLYASFDSVRDCYGDETPDFLELGLSADSSYGAGISDLREVPFLSNSTIRIREDGKC
jgi:PHP family Zn ribbon phosphoesterase